MVSYADSVPNKGLTRSLSERLSFATFKIRPNIGFLRTTLRWSSSATQKSRSRSRNNGLWCRLWLAEWKKTHSGMSHSLIKALNFLNGDPEPIWDLDYVKRPKFQIWPKDSQGDQEEGSRAGNAC